MKRVIAAVLLFTTAVSISVWAGITFQKKMTLLSEMLDGLIICSETCSDKELKEKTQELVQIWNDSSELLHSLVVHEEMDKLEEVVTALQPTLEYSEKSEFKNKCIEALTIIENLLKAEKINIGNILRICV